MFNPQQKKIIRSGLAVRIQHMETKLFLHSHAINYSHPGTSGQQEITCFGGHDDGNWWIIKNERGGPICNGDVVMLTHYHTEKNLHSHKHKSPVTGQQEVTGFGEKGKGDANDHWIIEFQNPQNQLCMDQIFKLRHKLEGGNLHSHRENLKNGSKQQEVTAFHGSDNNDYWLVDMDNEQISMMFSQKYPENKFIQHNTVVRFQHKYTKQFLHSHKIDYSHPNSSRQQEVTCFGNQDDNNWWAIRSYNRGGLIKDGDYIMLTHVQTMKNLHSHKHPSPVTN